MKAHLIRNEFVEQLYITKDVYDNRLNSTKTWDSYLRTKLESVKEILSVECCINLGYLHRIYIFEQVLEIG